MKYRIYSLLFITVSLFITSCHSGGTSVVDAETSAFGRYADSIDMARIVEAFHGMKNDADTCTVSDKAVLARYHNAEGDDAGLWFSREGMSDDAEAMLSFIRNEVRLAGLDSNAFFIPQIAEDMNIVRSLDFDTLGLDINDVLPRLDFNLSRAYMRFITGFRYGFMRPDILFNRMEYVPDTDDKVFRRLYDHVVETPDLDSLMKVMASEKRVKTLHDAVPVDKAYRALRKEMQNVPDSVRLALTLNMERLRWRIVPRLDSLGNRIVPDTDTLGRHILVNLPSQQLWAICPDSILSMRICYGGKEHKSPMLSSVISYMQVNPEWIVPQNIVKSDFLSHAGDSAYFARNDYFVISRSTGDTLKPSSVTRKEMEDGIVRIAQHRGKDNSLGRIIFRFANNYGIYLHDTNNHRAFNYVHRSISHGCIRIERPYEMALFMLHDISERRLDRLRISIDMEPESDWGKKWVEEHEDEPHPIMLMNYQDVSPHIPLRIVYFTAYPNPETNVVEYYEDAYGYDEVIANELKPWLSKY